MLIDRYSDADETDRFIVSNPGRPGLEIARIGPAGCYHDCCDSIKPYPAANLKHV